MPWKQTFVVVVVVRDEIKRRGDKDERGKDGGENTKATCLVILLPVQKLGLRPDADETKSVFFRTVLKRVLLAYQKKLRLVKCPPYLVMS